MVPTHAKAGPLWQVAGGERAGVYPFAQFCHPERQKAQGNDMARRGRCDWAPTAAGRPQASDRTLKRAANDGL